MFLKAFEVTADGFLNVLLPLGSGSTLRNAAWKRGTCDYKHSIFIMFEYHAILHGKNASTWVPLIYAKPF